MEHADSDTRRGRSRQASAQTSAFHSSPRGDRVTRTKSFASLENRPGRSLFAQAAVTGVTQPRV